MPAHASWKGHLKISLVAIPVQAFTAAAGAESSELALHQLHKSCKNRIQYKKFCPIHGEVPNQEIVSGYEYAEGQYAVLSKEELTHLATGMEKSLTIDAFVPPGTIDPIYFAGQSYYLVPDGRVGDKPYALVRDALATDSLCGVGEIVIARKQRLVHLRATKRLLIIDLLHHQGELRKADAYEDEVREISGTAQEGKLTQTLIEHLTLSKFDATNYTDDYMDQMRELIAAKVKGKHIAVPQLDEEPHVINFMDALKQSVKVIAKPEHHSTPAKKAAPKASKGPRKTARKKAHSSRKTG